jgi:two-component system invasion response regulator UvrY
MSMERIRAVLADDHTMVREALAQILAESGTVDVVGQAGDGEQALEITRRERPDVLVLDYSMPGTPALEVIERVVRDLPAVKVLVLTVHESIHYAVRVLEQGAQGFVLKSAAAQELLEAVAAVGQGEIYISPRVSHKVINQLRRPRAHRVGLESLSAREFELLRVLGAGMSLKECANHLNISTSTASTYRARLMEKLKLQSTAEVIRFALENEIVG